jgi:hypothetical protein
VKNSCWKWNETDTIDTICFRANGTVASRESNPRPRASAAASSSDSSSAGERAPADDGGDKPMSEAEPAAAEPAEPAEPACRPQGAKVDSQNDCCSGPCAQGASRGHVGVLLRVRIVAVRRRRLATFAGKTIGRCLTAAHRTIARHGAC